MSTTNRRRKSITGPVGWHRPQSAAVSRSSSSIAIGCCNQWMMMIFFTVPVLLAAFPVETSANSLNLVGKNCIVTEPLYNVTFNFSSLNSELAHHIKSDINEQFMFDVCDHLAFKCNGISGGAACLKRNDNTQVLLGRESQLHLTDGRIHFNFSNGEECRNGRNYSLDIILMCSYSSVEEPLSVIPYSVDQCGYFMFWTTKLACTPLPARVKANECAVKDETGYTFNLLPLSHTRHHVPDRSGSHFFVTACKPAHYGHMSMCPPGSSVCYFNSSESDYTKTYHDYGQTDPNPTIENNKLVMNFNSSNESCQNSKIIFECDPGAIEEVPEYVAKEGCVHLFEWRTPLACKKKESCAVLDANSGMLFNMSSLAGQKYTVKEANKTYEFVVCKNVGSQCAGSSGACEITKDNTEAIGLGNLNDELLFNITGAPYLLYKSGSICKQDQRWSTKIEFICETDKGAKTEPKLVENNNCEIIIQMETVLACKKQVSCVATNMSNDLEIDLSPLSSSEHNYEALVNDTLAIAKNRKFFLNVCRPLLSTYGLGCPGGSAACMAVQSGTDLTPKEELSMGFPDVSSIIVGNKVQLKYLRGSVCPQDNETNISTEIEFYCQPKAGRGLPILQEVMHDCHYRFEWPTNVVCQEFEAEFSDKSCEIVSKDMDTSVDLKKIFPSGELLVNPSKNSASQELKEGKVQLCSKNITVKTVYQDRAVVMFFAVADASCEETGDNINVNLKIECGQISSFNINEQSNCHLLLTQLSPHICTFVGASSNETDSNSPGADATTATTTTTTITPSEPTSKVVTPTSTASPASSDPTASKDDATSSGADDNSGTLGIILAVLTLISLVGAGGFLLLRNPERRDQLRSLFRRRNVLVQYSRVHTSNEEASLLMNPTAVLSDSDDEMLI
ncbi:cation-independent mannose-6-phosphate receptor [Armigeres subalbatus]|uniref:cation-independent mannose-6-phosphate receptor n=1 Tax=Armigeres subalbatus TaxID=124917 RepID=UPI002ED167A8